MRELGWSNIKNDESAAHTLGSPRDWCSESLDSSKLCKACSKCTEKQCPKSDSYPHMTAFDGSLIAGAFQSDYVSPDDPGVYAVPDVKGGEEKLNAYYGWKPVSGSASGYHRYLSISSTTNLVHFIS
ncbi:hypothetical protein SUGI_0783200 [Cryptomeria japonica]|nr:hypothetical protein SUGI_0783200 [Cryptomeria japonica]